MCRLLEVSRSGYYDWVDRSESNREKRHRDLKVKIQQAQIAREDHNYNLRRRIP